MNAYFKVLFSDKIILWSFYITVFLMLVYFLITLFSLGHLPPFIPIFNQRPWGEQRLGQTLEIFEPLVLSFIVFLVNFFFASKIYNQTPLVGRMLCATCIGVSFLALLFIIRTIQVIL